MAPMEPTPLDITLEAINYVAEDGQTFDGFQLTSERTTLEGQKTGIVFLHGLRGSALSGGIAAVAHALARKGAYCLTVNKRNSGKLYERSIFDEIDRDIHGAVAFLRDRGCDEIILWGRSLAATEVAYYQGTRKDADVTAVVLAAPFADIRERTTRSYFDAVSDDAAAAYESFVENARSLVESGRGTELVALPRPVGGTVEYIPMTATSFLSYRAPESACSTIEWTPHIDVPILLLPHDSEDKRMVEEANEIALTATQSSVVEIHPIEADHFFTGAEREVAARTADFVVRLRSNQRRRFPD
ncbi:hypothetical protein [Haladaptatus sp. DJG-WS-42]|uniref:alpha/beta hydrolase n=1 Tax=Haladaptatus sp. DJG-WS-42 TaxID=3120516 RepID=UPI0030CC2708